MAWSATKRKFDIPWLVAPLLVVGAASACASAEDPRHLRAEIEDYGWTEAVTPANTSLVVTKKLGKASDAISGHTLRQIVTDAKVKVRGDDKCCQACHAWSRDITELEFCEMKIPEFDALPTAKGTAADPPSAKPKILKDLFNEWRKRRCPP